MRNALWLVVFLSFSAQSPLAPNAPADKPVDVRSEAQLKKLKAAIAPFVADARKTWPAAKARYLKGLKPGESLFVSAELTDKKHHVEIVFIGVRKVAGTEISGHIASELNVVEGFEAVQAYTLQEKDLIDWTISKPDGTEDGNVVGKFLDTWSGR